MALSFVFVNDVSMNAARYQGHLTFTAATRKASERDSIGRSESIALLFPDELRAAVCSIESIAPSA